MKLLFLLVSALLPLLMFGQDVGKVLPPVIITEIFPDPTPAKGLPEKEFIEIFNNSREIIDLNQFILSDSSRSYPFPPFSFYPQTYLILCKSADTLLFKKYGSALGFKSFPTLNNNGDLISISDKGQTFREEVAYGQDYMPGITLERKVHTLCRGEQWEPSAAASGGTPGMPTVNTEPDVGVEKMELVDDSVLVISINQSVPSESWKAAIFHINGIACQDPFFDPPREGDAARLKLPDSVNRSAEITLIISGLVPCDGKLLSPLITKFLPVSPVDSLDIVFNELLFNPAPGFPDFVELVNRSSKFINLSGYRLVSVKTPGKTEEVVLFNDDYILPPGYIVAFTPKRLKLCEKYPESNVSALVEVSLPVLNDQAGTIRLLSGQGKVLDEFRYDENMHFPLLPTREGVSLERISSTSPTCFPSTWHSAASVAGYATPGKINSYAVENNTAPGWNIDDHCISPNDDSYHDFINISYNVAPGKVAYGYVFDMAGAKVKTLLNNATLPAMGQIQWDGTSDEGSVVPLGIYVLLVELFGLDGSKDEWMETLVVCGF